jgi:hypothetical protein
LLLQAEQSAAAQLLFAEKSAAAELLLVHREAELSAAVELKFSSEQSAAAELLRAERVAAAKVLMQARMPPEFSSPNTTTPQLLEAELLGAEQSAELLLQAEQFAAAAFICIKYVQTQHTP